MMKSASSQATHRLGFLDGANHELRTPLASILAFADVSLRTPEKLPEQEQRAWYEVAASARRLSRALDNVLDIMYLDSGNASLDVDFVDLVDVVNKVDETVGPRAAAKGVTFTSYVASGVPFIEADPDKLRRAIENVADNAVKFTPPGGLVVLHAFRKKIDDEVHICIDDNGIGLAVDDFDRIFNRFVQVDSLAARHYEGCGLGLAVAKSFVSMQGGRIEVQSACGRGSTFSIVLPKMVQADFGGSHEDHAR